MAHLTANGRIILSGSLIINNNSELLLLYRNDHHHYETPGGKINSDECEDLANISEPELKLVAERELREELGSKLKVSPLQYFGNVEFIIPDGRLAVAHKFTTKIISGEPHLAEPETFEKLDWLQINHLESYPLSPDLRLLLPKIKQFGLK